MADLYFDPVFYGIQDVMIPAVNVPARVIFPSEDDTVLDVPVREGVYPLIVFVHGYRDDSDGLCPPDVSEDYKRWLKVLHILARCGFVVVTPDVHRALFNPDGAAEIIEETVTWMQFHWDGRAVLWRPWVFLDPDVAEARASDELAESSDEPQRARARLGRGIGVDPAAPGGMTTHVGLAGHSWGARGCARAAARGRVRIKALASIAGAWDDNAAIAAFVGARSPTLMMAGTADSMNASYLGGLWDALVAPKHQALLHGVGHWDWFGLTGGIQPCDSNAERPRCSIDWQTAGELLLTFMSKYLRNQWHLPPTLIGPSGASSHLLEAYDEPARCGLRVRWNDPATDGFSYRDPQDHHLIRDHRQVGAHTFGSWHDYPF